MEKTARETPKPPTLKILPLNETQLYEIHVLTDDKAGELKWLVPITTQGIQDPTREYKFRGACVVQTPMGPQNVEFPIQAITVQGALDAWPRLLEAKILEMQKGFEEFQRRQLLAGANGKLT